MKEMVREFHLFVGIGGGICGGDLLEHECGGIFGGELPGRECSVESGLSLLVKTEI